VFCNGSERFPARLYAYSLSSPYVSADRRSPFNALCLAGIPQLTTIKEVHYQHTATKEEAGGDVGVVFLDSHACCLVI
jgi:hypothetical protein